MLKKTVTYKNIDDRDITEDFYFNFTKAELVELEVSRVGGFQESMKFLQESKDNQAILATIKEILLKAYGERSEVNRHFVKKPEFAEAFSHTEAYSNIFMELFEHADRASEFFKTLMPADMVAEANKEQALRAAPKDHRAKQAPAFSVVKDTPVEIIPSAKELPFAEFNELTAEEKQEFLNNNGEITS